MNAKRLLMIAYYFPPLGGAGVQRTVKFAKYLPGFGWNPVIFTVRSGQSASADSELSEEVPIEIPVYRSSALVLPIRLPFRVRNWLSRWILIVDEQLGWYPFAVSAASKILQKEPISALYSTSSPYTCHLIGLALKRRTHLPWIADFRDPWVGGLTDRFPTCFHRSLANSLEAQVFQNADRILLTSEATAHFYRYKYPALQPEKLVTITNGFDLEDFSHVSTNRVDTGQFTIVYSGSLYIHSRSAVSFVQALALLIKNESIERYRLAVYFVGNTDKGTRRCAREELMEDVIHFLGYLPHRESIGYLQKADLLLLIPSVGPGSEFSIPAKVFEYLAAGKPILTLAQNEEISGLIHKTNAGVLVSYSDVEAIAGQILAAYQRWERGESVPRPEPTMIARYERKTLTGLLANELDSITMDQT